MKNQLKLLCGSSNRPLAEEISKLLNMPLMPVELKKFSDGELYCRILESVRGCDVYIIQSTSPDVNHHLMELLIMADALKRSSPFEITAVVPYYGYCRQDKKHHAREPITAKLVANMIVTSGVSRLMTFDLHAPPVQGFFDIPTDNLEAMPLFAQHIVQKNLRNIVVVSPDAGGTIRARTMANELAAPLAIVDKRRPAPNVAEVMNIIGDVRGKTAIIFDDIIDTAGSLVAASEILMQFGAKEVYACATHAILSGDAAGRLDKSPLREIVVSNTINIPPEKNFKKLTILSIASLLAEGIKRTHEGKPMGVVYEDLHQTIQKQAAKLQK